ncbi:acyl-CoA carboxylase epsilon subunit [Nocardioides bruguierae]|uniref:Acyl-CoA carboxylase subunit epsilon n=1 Tax=Nocardioides bruguierae TaxID=2945102 RepID=A0A9X2IH15_9ACTN|nr:acyl-CoA carboxylase epsilon subunit [Nocardioides bruguierae]MCM0621325.1 acyl-CoA carboxylase subunit epsilon [Nocardioides bruguierae]
MSAESPTPEPAQQRPVLRVLTPGATPEEIAAVVAVVSALSAPVAAAPAPPRREWNHPARLVRAAHRTGRGAWRASAR